MPDIYLARGLDGFVYAYKGAPRWFPVGIGGYWLGTQMSFFPDSDTWPESYLPRGTMGRWDLVDRATATTETPATATSALTAESKSAETAYVMDT